ncbi:hypothetical protein [Bradyrhizobium retamae]|uniref:Uncharacterized protein n=1 Tax=Bradyrhizobium retamae TaxID=1300035 RepID=A0A0R3N1T0_9BRAD|nr:hypothetical protein [Bradyrhizobium retamae]KRR25934.1 hypothetical protein CQ13_23200 [Bradyrhizobium retamae]
MSDKPVTERGKTLWDFLSIVHHPAFRIGFLDARCGRPPDHDKILQRIVAETPAGALKRLGWADRDLFDGPDTFGVDSAQAKAAATSIEIAQYRYEEGRTLFLEYGVRCKAWGHPDYPPVAVVEFCRRRAREQSEQGD